MNQNELFGNKISINLPPSVRKVKVTIEKLVFEDGEVWKSGKQNIAQLQDQKVIQEAEVFVNMLSDKVGVPCIYYYEENSTCWQCTCGTPNENNVEQCTNCGISKQDAKKYLSEEQVKEEYDKFVEKQRRLEEQQKESNKYNDLIEKTFVEEQAKECPSKKQFPTKYIIPGILMATLLLCMIALVLVSRKEDKNIRRVLEKSLAEQFALDSTPEDINDYVRLLDTESDVLKYDGKKFEDEEFQTYIDGLKIQKESLDYYTVDNSKFWSQWNEGKKERYQSIMKLVSAGKLKISDDIYASCGIYILTDEIGDTINGRVTYQWDEDKEQYYYETNVKNITELNFENIVLNIRFGDELDTCIADEWKSNEYLPIKIYLSDETVSSESSLNLGLEFIKYQYNDIIVDITKSPDISNRKETTEEEIYSNSSYNSVSSSENCEADGCSKIGTKKYMGLSGEYEYYCEEHYREIMDMLDRMESVVGNGPANEHTCETNGCDKEGTYSITGLSGDKEYYCTEHYNELEEMLQTISN